MNPASHLERAMYALAKQPTERNRFAVYSALLTARLVAPLLPGKQVAAGRLPTAAELATDSTADSAVGGRAKPVFVVFDDDADLVRWRAGGGPRVRIAGTLLFPIMAEAGCASVKINPKSRIGGMLYGHEVETIAEAALRRAAQS